MTEEDLEYCRIAIEKSRQCAPEDDRPHPKVGAVVVRDGRVVDTGFRGEIRPGEHAEFTVMESKLAKEKLAGSTVYTTLEPCMERKPPKIPCAVRLAERNVERVVIGILDPHHTVHGKGYFKLRKAGIKVDFFPAELVAEVEEINREFLRQFLPENRSDDFTKAEFLEKHENRSLDGWYRTINYIFWDKNFNRDPSSLFMHLVEVSGGLSLLASEKRKDGVTAEEFIPKCIAWWLTLCGKVGIKSVEEMLWLKFPYVCTYCHEPTHDPDDCLEKKAQTKGPDWMALQTLATKSARPDTLGGWQRMFSKIYPAQQTEVYGTSFARLTEELGELAEAVRIFPAAPGYFLSEAADVFAWLMHIQNIIEQKKRIPKADRGKYLDRTFSLSYPDRCLDCNNEKCSCPPILEDTIGRITHEVPPERGTFETLGSFMTPDKARREFRISD